jgi:hypothetical protein
MGSTYLMVQQPIVLMKKSESELKAIMTQLEGKLIGRYSTEHESIISYAFISPNHESHARLVLAGIKSGSYYPRLQTDNLTIIVAFENGDLEGLTRLVLEDIFQDLAPLAQDLDYMQTNPPGNEKEKTV